MNLISRSCVDGIVCRRYLNEANDNPFIWSLIPQNSFIFLVNNFDNIVFDNIYITNSISDIKENIKDSKRYQELIEDYNSLLNTYNTSFKNIECYFGLVDNNIILCYPHHPYKFTKNKHYNLSCTNGLDCMYNVYKHKLSKMIDNPIFLYSVTHSDQDVDFDTKYPVIYYNLDKNRTCNKPYTIYCDRDNMYDEISKYIKYNFIEP